jgi:hypothetical protein
LGLRLSSLAVLKEQGGQQRWLQVSRLQSIQQGG